MGRFVAEHPIAPNRRWGLTPALVLVSALAILLPALSAFIMVQELQPGGGDGGVVNLPSTDLAPEDATLAYAEATDVECSQQVVNRDGLRACPRVGQVSVVYYPGLGNVKETILYTSENVYQDLRVVLPQTLQWSQVFLTTQGVDLAPALVERELRLSAMDLRLFQMLDIDRFGIILMRADGHMTTVKVALQEEPRQAPCIVVSLLEQGELSGWNWYWYWYLRY